MNYENYVVGTLSQDAFVMVNKRLAKCLGFVEAGLLAELIFTYQGVKKENAFFENGEKGPWFYLTQASVEERLGIKRREHENAIKNLAAAGILLKKKMGLPSKNYYQINWKRIVDIVDNSDENDPEPAPQSDWTKRTNKDERNVQTRTDETYKQDWTKDTSIHITKKELKEKDITKIKNKNLVYKAGKNLSEEELINIANQFYSEFALGRWSKKQWFALIKQFASESVDKNIKYPENYVIGSIKKMAHKHDLKNGKVEFKYNADGTVPFYDWLNKNEDDDELPW